MHMLDLLVEIPAHLPRRVTERSSRTDQRGLVIQRITRIGHKNRRDTQRVTDKEHRTRRIPCRITARFEGISNTTVGERRRIGFLLIQALAAELLHQRTVLIQRKEGIVFLRRSACQRLKPVGEMRSTMIHRPFADTDGYHTCYIAMDRTTIIYIVEQLIQYILRNIFLHFIAREYVACEIIFHFSVRHFYFYRSMPKCHF